jgi:glycosyltransferase involved in cell wall biosynthesis
VRVWIVNPYGTLPGEGWRDYRSVLIARALESGGHSTTWWVSNFDHRSKRFRTIGTEHRQISPHFDARIVPSTAYHRHISLARIRYETRFAECFANMAATLDEPDVLILAEPALFTSKPVLRYLEGRRTRLIVDVIDLWPELFIIALPAFARPFAPLLFAPLYRRRAALLRKADAIVAVSRDYLDIVPSSAPATTAVVYWGVDVASLAQETVSPPGISAAPRVVYAGTLGDNYDIMTILEAARLLYGRGVDVEIVIAGAGPRAKDLRAFLTEHALPNVTYLGSLDASRLTEVYATCIAALSTYVEGSTVSMPIKAYDYLAAGLPLINSLSRDLGRFVEEYGVGLQYVPEDASSLADAIARMCYDLSFQHECRRRALALAQQFDVRVQYGAFARLLERVATNDESPVRTFRNERTR